MSPAPASSPAIAPSASTPRTSGACVLSLAERRVAEVGLEPTRPLRARVFETRMSSDSITRPVAELYRSPGELARSEAMRIRRYTDQDIIEAVRSSFSIAQVLRMLRLSPTGANYKGMYANFSRLGLNTSHFTGQGHLKNKTHSWTPERPLAEIL